MKGDLAIVKGVTSMHSRQRKCHFKMKEGCPGLPEVSTSTRDQMLCAPALVPRAAGPQLRDHTVAWVISSTDEHAPLSCGMPFPKHKVKDEIIRNFKMTTVDH